jgi:hypothetical protein
MFLQDAFDELADPTERDTPIEKRGDRNLIRRIEDGWGCPACSSCRHACSECAEHVPAHGFERQGPSCYRIEAAGASASRVGCVSA